MPPAGHCAGGTVEGLEGGRALVGLAKSLLVNEAVVLQMAFYRSAADGAWELLVLPWRPHCYGHGPVWD